MSTSSRAAAAVAPIEAAPHPDTPAGPPAPLDVRPFAIAAVILVVVVVVAVVVTRPGTTVKSLPLITLPEDAVTCEHLESEGRTLVCVAEPASLHALTPAERTRRTARTNEMARAAGFVRVVFREGPERVWRVEDLRVRRSTTTGRAAGARPASSGR